MSNALQARPAAPIHTKKRLQNVMCGDNWLVCVDFQNIFRDSSSPWGAKGFDAAFANAKKLMPHFEKNIIFTRWLPTAPRMGAWIEYFEEFSFADMKKDDHAFELCTGAKNCIAAMNLNPKTLDTHKFNKFDSQMQRIVGQYPHIILCGVVTECCVLATAISAVDAGCKVSVILDACAAGRDYMQNYATDVFASFRPSLKVFTTKEFIDDYLIQS